MSASSPEPQPPNIQNNVNGTQNNVANDQYNAGGDLYVGSGDITRVDNNQGVINQRPVTVNANVGAAQATRTGCLTVNVVVTMVSMLAVLVVSSFLVLNSVGAPNLRGVSVTGGVAMRVPGLAAPTTQSGSIKGWAVGDRGAIFTYDGKDWKRYDGPVATNLNAIYYNGSSGWIVGDSGTILFIGQNQAVSTYPSPTKNRLISVAGVNPATATDDQGNVYSFDGHTWQPRTSPGSKPAGVVVPVNGGSVVVRSDGGLEVSSSNLSGGRNLVAGPSSTVDMPIVAAATAPANISPNSLWAVGKGGSIYGFNNGKWTKQASPTKADLYSIYFGSNGGWIVGADGTILSWQDGSWRAVSSPSRDALNSVYAESTEAWAVGDNGRILQLVGGSWVKRH